MLCRRSGERQSFSVCWRGKAATTQCVAASMHVSLLASNRTTLFVLVSTCSPKAAHVIHTPCGCSQCTNSSKTRNVKILSKSFFNSVAKEIFKNLIISPSFSCSWNKDQNPVQGSRRPCAVWPLADHQYPCLKCIPLSPRLTFPAEELAFLGQMSSICIPTHISWFFFLSSLRPFSQAKSSSLSCLLRNVLYSTPARLP